MGAAMAAPAVAVVLVLNESIARVAGALGAIVVVLIVLFLVLPFELVAYICQRLGRLRRMVYALGPHWHAISWHHSPALWKHRASLTAHAEKLAPHLGHLLADGAPLLRPDRLEVLVPLLPTLRPPALR